MCHRSSILLLLSSLLNFGVLIKTASFTTSTDNSVQNVLPSKILIADHERKLCVTKTCNETSKELLNSIDETINPCDNFYQFACGNFLKTTVLPNDTKQLISFKFLQNRIENRLYNHFSEESLPNDTNAIKQTKLFYKSCMDQTSSDVRGEYTHTYTHSYTHSYTHIGILIRFEKNIKIKFDRIQALDH